MNGSADSKIAGHAVPNTLATMPPRPSRVNEPIACRNHPRNTNSSAAAWNGTSSTISSIGGQKESQPGQAPPSSDEGHTASKP